MNFEEHIRDVPDFPKPGILFKDITPLLAHPEALAGSILAMKTAIEGLQVDVVAGIESRGFIFGAALAKELGVGFVPIRKPGKLPWKTRSVEYELEYGTDKIEIHEDACAKGDSVLIVDDLLATGGTMAAACQLIEGCGAKIASCLVLIELAFLSGRAALEGQDVRTILQY